MTIHQKILKHLREMRNVPEYTEADKKVIAYSLAFEGTIGLQRRSKKGFEPHIAIKVSEKDLLDNFTEIIRLGSKRSSKLRDYNYLMYVWSCSRTLEVYYILANVINYIPSKRKQKIAKLVMEFIEKRVKKGALTKRIPTNDEEEAIFSLISTLNKPKRQRDE